MSATLPFSTIALDAPGADLAVPFALLTGANAVAQRLRCRLRFFYGEWFLDTRQGVPYFRDVLLKRPSLGLIKSLFRRVILSTPGIVSIREYNAKIDVASRTLTIDPLVVVCNDGSVIEFKPKDFVVALPIG